MVDVAIVGGGIAGLTAANLLAERGVDVVVFDKAEDVKYKEERHGAREAFDSIGRETQNALLAKAQALGVIVYRLEITGVLRECEGYSLYCGTHRFPSRTVILANGRVPCLPAVSAGETLLAQAAVFDVAEAKRRFVGRRVAVLGDARVFLAAQALQDVTAALHILPNGVSFDEKSPTVSRLLSAHAVVLHRNARLLSAGGNGILQILRLVRSFDGGRYDIHVDGVLVLSDYKPQNEAFADILPLNGMGFVRAGQNCRTALAGLFAAGDTRAKPYRGLYAALADGVAAAEGVMCYLSAHLATRQYFQY